MSAIETTAVLMTDLVGSTAMSAALGPSEAEALRQEHFSLLRGPVADCEGREVKNLGDGLMVVFASASSATRCAVAMQRAVEKRNRSSDRQLGVRIGVSLGEADTENGDYFGPPVVEASRLCAAAQGGQILASELARAMAGARTGVAFESRGALELKGLPEPVPACEVVWEPEGGTAGLPLPVHLRGMPPAGFVGREQERAMLHALWRAATEGQPGVALISGEPGIGKTRLATHLAMTAHGDGGTVLLGRCSEEVSAPFRPWSEALAHLVDHAPDALLRDHVGRYGGELLRLVPQLRGRVPDTPDPRTSDPETERYLLLGAVTGLLGAAADESPLLLLLDDLHWVDPPSVALLGHVVKTAPPSGLLIVGTYRDSELSRTHPLSSALADFRREGRATRIALSGLSADEVAEVLSIAAGHDLEPAGVDLAREVERETDGNPFFVGEILRSLVESGGVVQQPDGRWTISAAPDKLDLPQSVREVVGQRVERLGEAVAHTLGIAAVIGREFDLELLARVEGADDDEVLDRLDAALEAALLVESAEHAGRFSFHHALVNHTLYEDLGRTRRARVHRRVAEALEDICGQEPGARLGELAKHWAAATTPTDSGRAVGYAMRAGQRALGEVAPDEALGWFVQVCEMLDVQTAPDPALVCDAHIGLGDAQRRTGDPAYRETLLGAARLALEHGDAKRLAEAVLANSRGRTSVFGLVDEERVELIERAIELVDPDDLATRGRLLSLLSLEIVFVPDFPRRKPVADEGLALARASQDKRALAHVLRDRLYAAWDPRDPADRRRACDEMLALADELDDPTLRFWALEADCESALTMGDAPAARRASDECVRLADELGQPSLRWTATYHAACLVIQSDLGEAERLAAEAYEIGTASGERDASMMYAAQHGTMMWTRGEWEPLIAAFTEMGAAFPGLPGFLGALSVIHAERGDLDAAREILETAALHDYYSGFVDPVLASTLQWWAFTSAMVGDHVAAARVEELLAPITERVIFNGGVFLGALSPSRGIVALVLGRRDEGEELIRAGMALNLEIDAPVVNARVLLAWGRVLERAGDPTAAAERSRRSAEPPAARPQPGRGSGAVRSTTWVAISGASAECSGNAAIRRATWSVLRCSASASMSRHSSTATKLMSSETLR